MRSISPIELKCHPVIFTQPARQCSRNRSQIEQVRVGLSIAWDQLLLLLGLALLGLCAPCSSQNRALKFRYLTRPVHISSQNDEFVYTDAHKCRRLLPLKFSVRAFRELMCRKKSIGAERCLIMVVHVNQIWW
jgi:hypothetical protein